MQNTLRQTTWKKNMRRLVAVAFLFFLLAEWGSHGIAFAHASADEGTSISSHGGEHEDPCQTLVRCSDGSRQDRPVPNVGHDAAQHNAFFERISQSNPQFDLTSDPRIARARTEALFRPPNPPFHPPELS